MTDGTRLLVSLAEMEAAVAVDVPGPADDAQTNAAPLLCPRCDTLVLRPGSGRWQQRRPEEGGEGVMLPKTAVPSGGWEAPEDGEELITEFWAVDDMYSFANIAFSRTVGRFKYLCCADCEFGPLGFHELPEVAEGGAAVADDPESLAAAKRPFYLAAARVAAATDERPPKPTRVMDSAAAAAAGIDLSAFGGSAPALPEPAPEPEAEDGAEDDGAVSIRVTFTEPWLGLFLEDRLLEATAGQQAALEVRIGRFNPVPPADDPDGPDGPGEAERSGQLAIGDVVRTIHGVDVRGIGTDDICRLVQAAPRPFEMRFIRRSDAAQG